MKMGFRFPFTSIMFNKHFHLSCIRVLILKAHFNCLDSFGHWGILLWPVMIVEFWVRKETWGQRYVDSDLTSSGYLFGRNKNIQSRNVFFCSLVENICRLAALFIFTLPSLFPSPIPVLCNSSSKRLTIFLAK